MGRRGATGGWIAAMAAAALLVGCGGRDTGMVRFEPDPEERGDRVHQVDYDASCRSGAECVVTFFGPGGRTREIFGARWTHRFLAATGQPLYLGVTVRQRCTGNYSLGTVRCDRASGFARVTIYVDGERVANEATFHRPRGIVRDFSFGVSTRYVIMPDTARTDSVGPDSVRLGTAAS